MCDPARSYSLSHSHGLFSTWHILAVGRIGDRQTVKGGGGVGQWGLRLHRTRHLCDHCCSLSSSRRAPRAGTTWACFSRFSPPPSAAALSLPLPSGAHARRSCPLQTLLPLYYNSSPLLSSPTSLDHGAPHPQIHHIPAPGPPLTRAILPLSQLPLPPRTAAAWSPLSCASRGPQTSAPPATPPS